MLPILIVFIVDKLRRIFVFYFIYYKKCKVFIHFFRKKKEIRMQTEYDTLKVKNIFIGISLRKDINGLILKRNNL